MRDRTPTIGGLMTAVMVFAVLMAARVAAPRDFAVVFRILVFEGGVALVLVILLLRVIPRDPP